MARAKPERSRSKTAAIDDLNQSIEQLQAFLSNVEDLAREGFPYLEGASARTELQLRECIKRAFGEKSTEYQTNRHHKLSFRSAAETKQTVTLIKSLIATLEDKKLDLQGLKSSASEEAPAAPAPVPPVRPQMTLVPPSAPIATVTIASATPVVPPPITMSVPLTTNVDLGTAVSAPSTVPTPPPAASPPPVEPAAPRQTAVSPPPSTQHAAVEPVSSLFRTQETKPLSPPAQPNQQPVTVPSPAPAPIPASEQAPSAIAPSIVLPAPASPQPETASSPTPAPIPASEPSSSGGNFPPVPPAASPSRHSATQEIPLPPRPGPASEASPAPVSTTTGSSLLEQDHLDLAKKIFLRFHAVARQLRLRGEYRATLTVEDELDAQDLLHALLRLQFDDINTDEWTPGYTNGAVRTTFFLNHDRLAIIVKKTRTGLSAKDLADQLRIDIERYRTRGRCATLLCFIYDPEGRIGNPRNLENELISINDDFTVDVLVAPK